MVIEMRFENRRKAITSAAGIGLLVVIAVVVGIGGYYVGTSSRSTYTITVQGPTPVASTVTSVTTQIATSVSTSVTTVTSGGAGVTVTSSTTVTTTVVNGVVDNDGDDI